MHIHCTFTKTLHKVPIVLVSANVSGFKQGGGGLQNLNIFLIHLQDVHSCWLLVGHETKRSYFILKRDPNPEASHLWKVHFVYIIDFYFTSSFNAFFY